MGRHGDVTISAKHWDLLETNLTLALKLYAQGVDKAVNAPVHGTSLWKWPDNFASGWWWTNYLQRQDYINDVNTLEQALLDEIPLSLDGRGLLP